MWNILFERYRPDSFLEIGVYRGQVLSLAGLLQRDYAIDGEIMGIGPFERIGDQASVVAYAHCDDWLSDIRANVARFGLQQPTLIKALSTDEEALAAIRSREWDMIYIDGNHDLEVVEQDWRNCVAQIKVGGVIVLDDSGLGSGFRPPFYATAGFPGPSQVANGISSEHFTEILQVGHNRAFERLL